MSTNLTIPEHLVYPVWKQESPGGFMTNSYNSHTVVVETPIGKKIVNNCSSEYTLIPNSAIISPLIKGLSDQMDVQVRGIAWKDAVFSYQIIAGKPQNENGKYKKDSLYPEIQILNSYNGKIRCSIRMGMFRVVCENGLSIPENFSQFSEFSHTPANEEDIAVDIILNKFFQFLEIHHEVRGVYDDLKFMPVRNLDMRVEEVIENTNFPAKFQDQVMDRLSLELSQGYKSTDWLVFNGFNYNLNHLEELNWDPAKKVKVDREILHFLLNS